MIDDKPGRIDLRPLGLEHDAAWTDSAVDAVMRRITPPVMATDIALLVRTQRRLLAIAAVLVLLAAAAVLMSRARAEPRLDMLAQWAEAGHVPTNGELLAAYHGYRP